MTPFLTALRATGLLLVLLFRLEAQPQPLYRMPAIQVGLSAGAGSVYGFGGPGVLVRYSPVTLHLSPSPFFAGAAIGVEFGPPIQRPACDHRRWFAEVSVIDDWLLGNSLRPSGVRNRFAAGMVVGLHHRLHRSNRLYLEYGAGITQWHTQLRGNEQTPQRTEARIYPLAVLRIAGILRWPVPPR